ncbi:MAG TPA: hypothetical protein VFJ97_02915 [Dermatophilaceae bacterium]|nr:hypothetical protein [Dermatophilaceae bacterium]
MPIVFCETRAQEWTYRFLAASLRELASEAGTLQRLGDLPSAEAFPSSATPSARGGSGASPAAVRAWGAGKRV